MSTSLSTAAAIRSDRDAPASGRREAHNGPRGAGRLRVVDGAGRQAAPGDVPTRLFIGGSWRDAAGGRTLAVADASGAAVCGSLEEAAPSVFSGTL